MGLYDTMQQAPTNPAAPVNGTSAQKQPMQQNAWQQKQQMRANPMMKGRPAMGAPVGNMQKPNNNFAQAAGGLMNAYQNRPNPTAGIQPGMQGGSRDMMQQKMQQLKAQQAAAAAQSQPAMRQESPAQQYGLPTLQTPYDQQQQPQQNPMRAPSAMEQAQEQMRGYEGPDLGSQDPRELARVAQQNQGMTSLYGSAPIQQVPPFGGENPGSNGFQSMMENTQAQRPDVMDRGIGPSAQLFGGQPMDEMRRGPR